jgi:hypothetical protein
MKRHSLWGAQLLLRSLCCFLIAGVLGPASAGQEFRAELRVVRSEGQIRITPVVEAERNAELRYELTSEKSGGAGRSRTSQSGVVRVRGGQPATLSTLTLSEGTDDRYTVTLRLYEGGALVLEQVLRHPD